MYELIEIGELKFPKTIKIGDEVKTLKVSDEAYFEMHIDTDDANAFMLKQGDIVDIIE